MKQFTDEQIIAFWGSLKEAAETDEVRNFLDDVLDLINRQKAEIIRLKGEVVTNNIMKTARIKKEAKSEAIKEFAERVETLVLPLLLAATLEEKDMVYRCLSIIDNLVKEMTEEKSDV